jgi:transcription initiation factor TFIIIB Brf1 subunit/transcription initiation factor TFIIB
MPKPEEDLINRLTLRPEVKEKTRALLRLAHSKTGPGTGYDIGEAKVGLPAICAYIASKRYALYVTVYAFYFIYIEL